MIHLYLQRFGLGSNPSDATIVGRREGGHGGLSASRWAHGRGAGTIFQGFNPYPLSGPGKLFTDFCFTDVKLYKGQVTDPRHVKGRLKADF